MTDLPESQQSRTTGQHAHDDQKSEPPFTNRLIHETSPYLLQHAHNPVDWYPWGPEALEKARAEDKPILLSVGYSACHWCHRLREESFEDEATAAIINRSFVSIKVDREERPDIDALYMDAVQALTGSGGWPMTVFLVPEDGAPFFGGTYFPPKDRFGIPSFTKVLQSMADLYRTRREDVEQQAEEFRKLYRRQSEVSLRLPTDIPLSSVALDPEILEQAADRLLAMVDAVNGGFGRAPKFPHPMGLEYLLRMEARARASQSNDADDGRRLQLIRLTLDKMARGGVNDQVGGGFHRYATDAQWQVPHFEKMLYDNALLAQVYLHAWQLTGEPAYRRICEEVLDYVLREMTDPEGGFYSTQDADSDGIEGAFYVWTREELRQALGEADAALAEQIYQVTEAGNFEGRNILHLDGSEAEIAAQLGRSESELRTLIERIRKTLYETRSRRHWPGRDDKVLAVWNGFMLRAMAEGGRVLSRTDYTQAARRNAEFLLGNMIISRGSAAGTGGGDLLRSWRQGSAKIDAYLEDYASVVNGLLSIYETTGEVHFLSEAKSLADRL